MRTEINVTASLDVQDGWDANDIRELWAKRSACVQPYRQQLIEMIGRSCVENGQIDIYQLDDGVVRIRVYCKTIVKGDGPVKKFFKKIKKWFKKHF